MLKKTTKFFSPPIFQDDEDKTRIAGMLHLILLVFLSSISVAFLLAVTGSIPITNRAFISSSLTITVVAVIALLVFVHKGYIRAAAWTFLFFQWSSTVMQVIWSGGIKSPVVSAFIITILLAGFLINRRAVFWFTGLSILTILGVLQLERAGHLPLPIVFVSPLGKVFIILTIIAISAALLILVTRALNNALTSSRAHTKKLEQAIREKTQAEAALQQSENIYRRAIMAAGAVPYVFDPATRTLRFLGEGILPMTGYSASELMSLDQWNTVELEGFPRGKLAHLTFEEANRITDEDISIPWECDFRILTRDGQTRWIADTSVKGFDETGKHIVAIGIKQDITARKQAEIERESLIKELEKRNAEMERFLYTASHDLKSPVVTIKGFLGLLKKDMRENDQNHIQKDFERISEAAEKMGTLLSELLELSRVGRVANPPTEIDLVILVQEALETLDGNIRTHNVKVTISPELPTVYADRNRLREVIENLIDNAIKYMGDQPNPLIEIDKRQNSTETIICIKDNGIGIEQQFQTKIFGLFEKLNPGTEGTGIGLAIVKRIIEVHGGRIWVESEGMGKGSTFCFTIPNIRQANPTDV